MTARDGSCEAVATAILERAQAMHASMLAIAPHERTATERVLKGSVTDFLARCGRGSGQASVLLGVVEHRPSSVGSTQLVPRLPCGPPLSASLPNTRCRCRRARIPLLVVRGIGREGEE